MIKQFRIDFPNGMPKGTAQQKRYNSQTGVYFKDKKLINLERTFTLALRPHRPKDPIECPVKLTVWFGFEIKQKARWGEYKPTRPDCDNYIKEFKDVMTKEGFWIDDSQVADERNIKTYSENAFIWVRIEELNDRKFGGIER